MAKTMKEHASDALMVQNACNLSGVVRSFTKATEDVWVEANAKGLGTDYVNTHPVCVLYASKIASLTGCDLPLAFSWAYEACEKLAEVK